MRIFTLFARLLFIMLLAVSANVDAAFLRNIPIILTQPNGNQIHAFTSGDEYYQWIHDANDFTIIINKETHYYVYAKLLDGSLVPTPYIVGQKNPASAGLTPGQNIPEWKYKMLRDAVESITPKKPAVIPDFGPSDVSGNVNNLVVFIRFSDQTEFPSSLTYYSNMFNSTTTGDNSMYNYFNEVSYNQLFINSTFYPTPSGSVIVSYQDTHPRSYYMPYDETTNPEGYSDANKTSREHTLLANAIAFVASMVPAGLNLDFDNDGYVDNVCFIVRGATTAWNTLLWPHRWALFSQTVSINGKQVWDYNLQLEDFISSSGNGVLCHEMSHTFSFPDLYHYSDNGISPVGSWDVMESTSNPPQHMGAYMKYKYTSWATIPTITSSGTYTLNPLTSSTNNAYKLASLNSTTEFFVFEYRKKAGTFENSLPGSGLLIYRINTLAGDGNADGPPDEIYLYRPYGTLNVNGNPNQAYFSNSSGRTEFNNTTNPNDFLSDSVTLGDIDVSNVTTAGTTISFTVSIGSVANFTADKTNTCTNETVGFLDQSIGGPTSWSWSFSPSTVSYQNGSSSSSQNPQVKFTAAGIYSVSLTINGPGGSNTKTRNNYIQVQATGTPPFTDNFESGSFSTNNWTVVNPDDSVTWNIYTGAGGNGSSTKSAYMNFYNYPAYPQTDEIIMPAVSLEGMVSAMLTFKVAYRPYNATFHDTLKVIISNDCGATYSNIVYSKTGTALATGPAVSYEFIPSASGDWRTESISLLPYLGSNIRIKFQAINGYGNNLFIDDISLTGTAPVIADFSGTPTTLCQGSTVQFTDLTIGAPTSWYWVFGDGQTSLLQNPSHTYNVAGNFTVSLTATKAGYSNTKTKTNYITVNPSVPVTVSVSQSPPGSICQGASVTFTATVTNGGTNPIYQWKRNGTNAGTNSPTYEVSNLTNGEVIACQVTSNVSCPASNPVTSSPITVTVLPTVSASLSIAASPSIVVCSGTTVTFTATPGNGGSSPSFQWQKNGVNVGNNSTSYVTNQLVNGDVIQCTMISNQACVLNNPVAAVPVVMTVNNYVTPTISISASPSSSICTGTSVTFSATPTNGGTSPVYQWKRNGVNVGTNSSTYVTNTLQNGEYITCQLTSSLPCVNVNPVNSNPIVMIVNNPVTVSVSISADPGTTICQGQTVVFSSNVTNGGTNPTYIWKRNNVTVGFNATYTSSSLNNGDVVFCQVNSNASCVVGNPAVSNNLDMTVHSYQSVSVTIAASPPGPVCQGTEVTYSATVNNGGSNPGYQWKRNNVTVGTDPAYTVSDLMNGDQIKCVVTSDALCVTNNPATSNTLTAVIQPPPAVDLGVDTIIPVNTTLILDAGPGMSSYLWNTGATSQTLTVYTTGLFSVTVTDVIGCTGNGSIQVQVGFHSLDGYLTYLNTPATPIDNSTVYLKMGSTLVSQTITDGQGYFSFNNLEYGTYKLSASTAKIWGGVNATDALIIMKHFVGISVLNGLKKIAGNVDLIPVINSTDALMVSRRFIGLISSFPVGDWVYDNPSVVIDGSQQVLQNLKLLTTGDVDGSYVPTARLKPAVVLIEGPQEAHLKDRELTITLFSAQKLEAGAISLVLECPANWEVTQVEMLNSAEPLMYNVVDGTIRISWYQIQPLVFETGDPVLKLSFHIEEGIDPVTGLIITSESEISDSNGVPYEQAVLWQPRIIGSSSEGDISSGIFPNPVTRQSTVWFTMEKAEVMNLILLDEQGRVVKTFADGMFPAGHTQFEWNGKGDHGNMLAAGVYHLKGITCGKTMVTKVILTGE